MNNKILIIEDNEAIREDISLILTMEGYSVDLASQGREGYAKAQKEEYDLILCDVMMPEMDGFELLDTLRKENPAGARSFVFLTARSSREDLRRGMNLGAEDYLTKPFTANELLQMVRARIKRSGDIVQHSVTSNLLHERAIAQIKKTLFSREKDSLMSNVSIDRYSEHLHVLGELEASHLRNRLLQQLKDAQYEVVSSGYSNSVIVLLEDPGEKDRLEVLRKLQACANHQDFTNLKKHISFTVSIGVVPVSGRIRSEEEVGHKYHSLSISTDLARKLDRNRIHVYSVEDEKRIHEDTKIENYISSDIEMRSFELYLQPRVNVRNGQIESAEALLRWNHPEMGLVSPARFIPVMEERGSIKEVGLWVVREALRMIKVLQQNNLDLEISVNVSGEQLKEVDFYNHIKQAMEGFHQDEIQRISFEITESVMSSNISGAMEALHKLSRDGFRIYIDDFGTGFSSLSTLQSLPANGLKIDRAFIRNLEEENGKELIQHILDLGRLLHLDVVVEGVETHEQLQILRSMGCEEIQGYYFSKPLAMEEFMEYARQNRHVQEAQNGQARGK